jgi:hypothetical protein
MRPLNHTCSLGVVLLVELRDIEQCRTVVPSEAAIYPPPSSRPGGIGGAEQRCRFEAPRWSLLGDPPRLEVITRSEGKIQKRDLRPAPCSRCHMSTTRRRNLGVCGMRWNSRVRRVAGAQQSKFNQVDEPQHIENRSWPPGAVITPPAIGLLRRTLDLQRGWPAWSAQASPRHRGAQAVYNLPRLCACHISRRLTRNLRLYISLLSPSGILSSRPLPSSFSCCPPLPRSLLHRLPRASVQHSIITQHVTAAGYRCWWWP